MRTTTILLAIAGFATLSLGATTSQASLKQLLADKSKLIKKSAEPSAEGDKPHTFLQTEAAVSTGEEDVPAAAVASVASGCGCCQPQYCDCCAHVAQPCAEEACCNLCGPDLCDFSGHGVASSEDCFETNQRVCCEWVPDTLDTTEEESVEATAEETVEASCSKGCKTRHFCIDGDISVTENVYFNECSKSESKSDGNGCAASYEISHGCASQLPCPSSHTVCLTSPLQTNSVCDCNQ